MSIDLEPPQTEIVRLICLSCTSKEVAKILDLTLSRVENHKAAAMLALGAINVSQLKELALEHQVAKRNDGMTKREKRLCGRNCDESVGGR